MALATPFWQEAWDNAQSRLTAGRLPSQRDSRLLRAPRVGQLDAEQLDAELVQLLKEPLVKAVHLLSAPFSLTLEPELLLIIQSVLYKYSVWDFGATQGAKLQGLQYQRPKNTEGRALTRSRLLRRTIYLHAFLTIVVPYLHTRARAFALSHSWPDTPSSYFRRKAWDTLTRAEAAHASCALLSFIAFLWDGKYRTLVDRMLGLQLVPAHRVSSRNVSYEFMNRQMVWHAFTEFILFLLPLVNTRVLRRRLNGLLSRVNFTSVLPRSLHSFLGVTPAQEVGKKSPRGKYSLLPENQCAICADDASYDISGITLGESEVTATPPLYPIHTPYRTSCGHLYCYFCIARNMIRAQDDGEPGWECLRCTTVVYNADRVNSSVEDGDGFSEEFDGDSMSLGSMDSLRSSDAD